MKKLLAIAAAAIIAASTQAAAVGWTLMGANDYAGGDYSIFAIGLNGVTGVSQITDLVAAGEDVSSYAIGGGSVSSTGTAVVVPTSANAASITYTGTGGATQTYNLFAVVWTSDGTAASVSSTTPVSMANNDQGKTALFSNQSTNFSNNKFDVVPEPTSVALLALGLAALGLKRKVA